MGQWAFQKDDGTRVDHAWVSGYHFGDRLLEGVYFKVKILEDNRIVAVAVDNVSQGYFKQLNEKMWFDAANDYAQRNDIFFEDPGHGDDIFVVDMVTGETCPNCKK